RLARRLPRRVARAAGAVGRVAHLHRVWFAATVRRGDLAAASRRPRPAAGVALVPRAARPPEGRAGLDVPLRHRVEREECSLGRRAAQRRASAGASAPERPRARVRLGREAVRRLADGRAGGAARRDARLRDGRQSAVARARRPRQARDPGDVRLQERQVAGRDQPRPACAGRILGAARLRPRRLGRTLERVRHVTRYVRRFSRTERTLHWANAIGFFVLLATGLILYLPRLVVVGGRRPLIRDVHFWSGVPWIGILVAIALAGDRRGIVRLAREVDRFDRDDLRWLLRRRPAPQGRLNAGQKLNT